MPPIKGDDHERNEDEEHDREDDMPEGARLRRHDHITLQVNHLSASILDDAFDRPMVSPDDAIGPRLAIRRDVGYNVSPFVHFFEPHFVKGIIAEHVQGIVNGMSRAGKKNDTADGVQRVFSVRSRHFCADHLLEVAQPPVEELV